MLINMKEMLNVAEEYKFAVPAFNAGSGQLLTAVMESAEKKQAPFIMAIHPDELSFLRDSFISQVIYECNNSKIPIVIHLDHGANFEQVIHAIKLGFTSVMIDSSKLPFEENIAITKKVVEVAHAVGVSVEAELGTIGDTGNSIEGGVTKVVYTDPNNAKEFVERTQVDSLAVAIGTAHGIYPKNLKPELKMDILKEIDELVEVPLVLHGGSSNPDEEIARSIELGIRKINISSDIKVVFAEKLREVLAENEIREPNVMFPECIKACRNVIDHKIELFNDTDKIKYFKLSK